MQETSAALQKLDARVAKLLEAYEQLQIQNTGLKESVVRLTHDLHQKDTELTLLHNQKGAAEAVHNITPEEKAQWREEIDRGIQQVDDCLAMTENLK